MVVPTINITYWKITFHNRGSYLPGFHKVFGSTFVTTLMTAGKNERKRQLATFLISRAWNKYLDKGGVDSCQSGFDGASLEECIDNYLESEVGCRYYTMLIDHLRVYVA